MAAKKNITNNPAIIPIQSADRLEISLKQVKIALKRILKDYEDQQIENGNSTYDVFNDIQNELGEGYFDLTLRKWINTSDNATNEIPKPNQLVLISKFVKNRKAVDALIAYLNYQAEGLK